MKQVCQDYRCYSALQSYSLGFMLHFETVDFVQVRILRLGNDSDKATILDANGVREYEYVQRKVQPRRSGDGVGGLLGKAPNMIGSRRV